MVTYIPLQHITLKALVWLWTHCEIQKSIVPVLLIIGLICSYKGLILDLLLQDETFVGANKTDNEKNGNNTLLDFTAGPKPYQGCQSNVVQETGKNKISIYDVLYQWNFTVPCSTLL